MKFFKTLAFSALAFCIVLFSSCSKDNSDVAASATITATIDGTPTTFDKNVMGASSTFNGANVTSIQGSDAQGNRITISLKGNLIAGKPIHLMRQRTMINRLFFMSPLLILHMESMSARYQM